MSWKDYLYFSKGERRGLIIILFLIVVGGTWMWYSQYMKQPNDAQQSVSQEKQANNIESNTKTSSDSQKGQAQNTNTQTVTSYNQTSTPTNEKRDLTQKGAQSTDIKEVTSKPTTTEAVKKDVASEDTKESVSERVQRLTSNSRPSYPQTEKFTEGTVIELNAADTTTLKKIPGIGSAYARRIVSYRNLLGGYYDITQIAEVYGIDEERYATFVPWFNADPSLIKKLNVNNLPLDSLVRHPYINYAQAKVITQLRRQKGKLTGWENLILLSEFTEVDKIRLIHYLSFE